MPDAQAPDWMPSPECPPALARAFADRDLALLATQIKQSPDLLHGGFFLCMASRLRYHDPSSNLLMVPADIARVAVSLHWWEGLAIIRRAGRKMFEADRVDNTLWLAIVHGDTAVVGHILEGAGRAEIPSLPLLAMAGQPRNQPRQVSVQSLVEAFGQDIDAWRPVPSTIMPAPQQGLAVCKLQEPGAQVVSFCVEADPDLYFPRMSCIHVLLSENLPLAAATLVAGQPVPAGVDHTMLLTHWFSGATRHANANAKQSASALLALIDQGLPAPSPGWLVGKSRNLEDFGLENFDQLMLELVRALSPPGQWTPSQVSDLLKDPGMMAPGRDPEWIGLLFAKRSSSRLRAATAAVLPGGPKDPGVSRL